MKAHAALPQSLPHSQTLKQRIKEDVSCLNLPFHCQGLCYEPQLPQLLLPNALSRSTWLVQDSSTYPPFKSTLRCFGSSICKFLLEALELTVLFTSQEQEGWGEAIGE